VSYLRRQGGLSRVRLLLALLLGLILLTICVALYLSFRSSAEINGRHHASGEVQLSNGQVLELSHSLHIHNGRFYSMTRQGNSVLETSGVVEHGFLGHYRLRVEDGDIRSLSGEGDDTLVFNLMYAGHPQSTINLHQLNNCLYAQETQQLFCPDS
jgi:hypothetical protein